MLCPCSFLVSHVLKKKNVSSRVSLGFRRSDPSFVMNLGNDLQTIGSGVKLSHYPAQIKTKQSGNLGWGFC